MCKVLGNTWVNVAEAERGKALNNLLGGRAKFEMVNDRIQTYSRALDSDSSLLGYRERYADGLFPGNHNGLDYT